MMSAKPLRRAAKSPSSTHAGFEVANVDAVTAAAAAARYASGDWNTEFSFVPTQTHAGFYVSCTVALSPVYRLRIMGFLTLPINKRQLSEKNSTRYRKLYY